MGALTTAVAFLMLMTARMRMVQELGFVAAGAPIVRVDGDPVCHAKGLKVGLFTGPEAA